MKLISDKEDDAALDECGPIGYWLRAGSPAVLCFAFDTTCKGERMKWRYENERKMRNASVRIDKSKKEYVMISGRKHYLDDAVKLED